VLTGFMTHANDGLSGRVNSGGIRLIRGSFVDARVYGASLQSADHAQNAPAVSIPNLFSSPDFRPLRQLGFAAAVRTCQGPKSQRRS
jgi:hypothetical protein